MPKSISELEEQVEALQQALAKRESEVSKFRSENQHLRQRLAMLDTALDTHRELYREELANHWRLERDLGSLLQRVIWTLYVYEVDWHMVGRCETFWRLHCRSRR